MIQRSTDVFLIKRLMNEAKLRSTIVGSGFIKKLLRRSENIFLIDEHGGILFEHGLDGPESYRIVLFLTPAGRGAWGKAMIQQAFSWMFRNTSAKCLLGLAHSDTVDLIRIAYPPPGGIFEKVEGDPHVAGRWTYKRENWSF